MAMKPFIYCGEVSSPLGPISLLATENGICKLHFGSLDESIPVLKAWCSRNGLTNEWVSEHERFEEFSQQLNEYFIGIRKNFTIPLDIQGDFFEKKVWEQTNLTRYGETISFREIAKEIGSPKEVRKIGCVVNRNPLPILIPCHRVIGSNGALVGYNGGLEKKERLLEIEKKLKQIS
jgi:methylated-DNA-[protein]-cysteine S-methyltransferase